MIQGALKRHLQEPNEAAGCPSSKVHAKSRTGQNKLANLGNMSRMSAWTGRVVDLHCSGAFATKASCSSSGAVGRQSCWSSLTFAMQRPCASLTPSPAAAACRPAGLRRRIHKLFLSCAYCAHANRMMFLQLRPGWQSWLAACSGQCSWRHGRWHIKTRMRQPGKPPEIARSHQELTQAQVMIQGAQVNDIRTCRNTVAAAQLSHTICT